MDYRLNAIQMRYGGDKDGSGLRIRCPVHNGEDKNCSVWIDEKDQIGAVCHSHQCDVNKYLWAEFDPPQPKRGRISKEQRKSAVWLPKDSAEMFEAPRRFKDKDYAAQWQYYDRDRVPINLVVVRYEDKITGKKDAIPYIYAKLDDGRTMWLARGPGEPQWYGLQTLDAHDTVLIVEGEKTAVAAWHAVKDRMAVMTWQGGSSKHVHLDLSVLRGKNVILWPDYDEPGFKWAWKGEHNLYDKLKNQGNHVSLIMWDGGEGADAADVKTADQLLEIIGTAGSARQYKLASLYKECTVANEIDMTDEMAKTLPCGMATACAHCKYNYIPAISHPIQTLTADPVLHKHAYIISEEIFVDLDSFRTYNHTGFNARYASEPGYSLASQTTPYRLFIEDTQTLKVHEREFKPGYPMILDGRLNLAKPLVWESRGADPTLWLRLGQHLFRKDEMEHVLDWLAFTIQNPHEKIEHTLLILGAQGIGKSLFFAPIEAALRRVDQHKSVNSTALSSAFNDFLVNTKLLTMEELNVSGSGYSMSNKLKEWQAAPPDRISINPKFAKPFYIPNIVNIIAYSNYDLPVKIEQNQRRWYIIRSDAERLADQDFYTYDEFNKLFTDESIDTILSYLQRRDITTFNRGNAPTTDAARDMELNSIAGMRDLREPIEEIVWPDMIDLRLLRARLEEQLGPMRWTAKHYANVVTALGWTKLPPMVVNGKTIRPWSPNRGALLTNETNAYRVDLWKRIRMGEAIP